MTNVETQLWTAVTDMAAFSTTIPLISWYESQVINMHAVHDMAHFVAMSIWHKAGDMEKNSIYQ